MGKMKKKAPHLLNDNVRLPPMRAPSECVKMPTISRAESGGAAYATRWAAAQFGETTKPLTSGSVYVYAMRVAATPYTCGSHGPSYHMCFLPPYLWSRPRHPCYAVEGGFMATSPYFQAAAQLVLRYNEQRLLAQYSCPEKFSLQTTD